MGREENPGQFHVKTDDEPHGGNIGMLDGHVEWRWDPYCGPKWDNIWLRRRTDVSTEIDPQSLETLRAYNDEASYNGTSTLPEDSQDDSFLVP